MNSGKKSYVIDRVLHWLSSALIVLMLLIMGSQIHNTDYRIKGAIQHKQDAIEIHIIMGGVLLLLLLSRIIWSQFFLPNLYKQTFQNVMHKNIVSVIHWLMYFVLFALIATGALMAINYEHPLYILNVVSFSAGDVSSSLFNQANTIHLFLEDAMYYLIALHFVGAMYSRR